MNYGESYDVLARVYDAFQGQENPLDWAVVLDKTYKQNASDKCLMEPQGGEGRPLALDLGCGTASISRQLAAKGYDIIGIDLSEAMLDQAREKWFADTNLSLSPPLLLLQDVSDFELFGTVNFIFSTLDTFNHLTEEQLGRCLERCSNYIHPGGVLCFDLLSEAYMTDVLGSQLYYDLNENETVLWLNSYDKHTKVNTAQVTLFSREKTLYRREDVEILEYFHEPSAVVAQLLSLGFETLVLDSVEAGLNLPGLSRYFLLARNLKCVDQRH